MEYALVASILASDPSKLQDLIWDNVQQPAKATYQLTIPRQPYHQQTLSPWNNLAPFNGNINSYLSAAGPMVNLLGSLAGRCTNLTSLELHKTAERGPRHTQESSEFTPAYSARDEDIYVEWAHFLVSVKSTLEDIVWEQGQCDFKLRSRVLRRGAWPLIRLMDVRFESQIWPLITGQAHDWPCLKRLTVRGVRSMFGGTFVRHRDFRDHILDALWEKFGNELEIQLEGVREGVLEHIGMEVRS